MNAVEFEHVSKSYSIYEKPGHRLKELLTFNRRSFHRDFWALQDLSFEVRQGETFCIVGENGSGKSTTLQMIAGILRASSGRVSVAGRVSALLELGAGFNPEFSGRDNVYLNGSILGLSNKEIDRRYRQIEEFAEIGDFIDQPVKTYSSGMTVRLAFAVAINVDPEILLVDEALAVGDIYFRHRCMRKVHELRTRGITIVFVSHAIGDVKAIGDRVLWLENGRMKEIGKTDIVVAKYLAAMVEKDGRYLTHSVPEESREQGAVRAAAEVVTKIPNIDHRYGDGRAEIIGIAVLDENHDETQLVMPGTEITLRVSIRAKDSIALPNAGFMMRNHLGIDFSGTNTTREDYLLPPMNKGDVYTVDFHLQVPELYPGSFSFSPAIADGTLTNYKMCDWIDNAITIQVGHGESEVYGYLHLPCRVELNESLWGAEQRIA